MQHIFQSAHTFPLERIPLHMHRKVKIQAAVKAPSNFQFIPPMSWIFSEISSTLNLMTNDKSQVSMFEIATENKLEH